MAENKKSFVLYADLIHTVKKMPLDKAGLLLNKILQYVNDLDPQDDDMLVDIVFEPIKLQMKRDLEKWEEIREKRVQAGKSGGIKSGEARAKQNEASASQEEANEAVTVNVTVTDTVNVIKNNKKNITEASSVYSQCMDLYDRFIRFHTDAPAKIDQKSGAALKKIIKYIEGIVTDKTDKMQVTNALEYIFTNYSLWDAYHQKQLTLNQIDSNLINIINSIKNGRKITNKTTTYSSAKEFFNN